MYPQIQAIGVNERLGNVAFRDMQGTTRGIFDSLPIDSNAVNPTLRFFDNVQSRAFPRTNLTNNRFEIGESLCIQSVAFYRLADNEITPLTGDLVSEVLLNVYIGNQRVLKDFAWSYAFSGMGRTNPVNPSVLYLETPIVIPQELEFYVEATFAPTLEEVDFVYCQLQGFGTLLNTQNNF